MNSDKIEFGLEGGFNYSSITGMESSSSIAVFNLGFYFDLKLKRPEWSIYTGVLVKSTQGLNNLTENDLKFLDVELREEEGIYRQELRGFLVPVMIKYKFNKSIYIAGGVQFGLVTKAYVEFNSDIDDIEIREREYNRDDINRIDVGAIGGLGYQFPKGPKWTLGAKYYYGFVDVYKSRSGTRNSSWFLELDIPVGKNKGEFISHKGEECGIILEGRLKAYVGDQVFILEDGDCIYLDSSMPHRWENISEIEVRAFWINTPATF